MTTSRVSDFRYGKAHGTANGTGSCGPGTTRPLPPAERDSLRKRPAGEHRIVKTCGDAPVEVIETPTLRQPGAQARPLPEACFG